MAAKMKIKKGDTVVVLAGKDKGKTGEVKKVMAADSKVLVDGVNVKVKHRKPSQMGPGGLDKIEAPIHVSNVSVVDPKDQGKGTKIGYKMVGDNKVRFARRSGEVVD